MADETEIAASSACFTCLSPLQQAAAVVWLLNEIAATGLTPEQVAAESSCFTCMTRLQSAAAGVYLLDQIL